jgi:hypothetical protein
MLSIYYGVWRLRLMCLMYMDGTYLSFIDIPYDVLLEAYVDIMVHEFFISIRLHVETYSWMIGTYFMEDFAYMYGTHHFFCIGA